MNKNAACPTLSVCIATHKRSDRLRELLKDIAAQTQPCNEVIIVDNDSAASAREVVEAFSSELAATHPVMVIRYEVQPIKNISITRNRTVALAAGEWLIFVDDDERVPPDWLESLVHTAITYQADGVLAPVVPVLPDSAPNWIKRGKFYDWPRVATGQQVPAKNLRFGNVMLRRELLRKEPYPFDPAYGTTGGEDGDLLCRLELKGAKLVWSDEAIVHEPVEVKRLSARWLWMRAMRGGQDFARHTLSGRYGVIGLPGKMIFVLRAFMQMLIAVLLSLAMMPLGLHQAMRWVIKIAANFGKLSFFFGKHYQEYG